MAAASGDHDAYLEFYDVMAPTVYGLCHRITRDHPQAQGAALDTFVDLWRMAPAFDPQRHNVRSWSAAAAYRRAVDRVRATTPDRPYAAGGTNSAELLVLTRARDALGTFVEALPVERRTMLDMLVCRGAGVAAVAQRWGVPVTVAATSVTAALRQISAAWAGTQAHAGDARCEPVEATAHPPASRAATAAAAGAAEAG